jgi:hypothetical protein
MASETQVDAAVAVAKAAVTDFAGVDVTTFIPEVKFRKILSDIIDAALSAPVMDNPNQPLAPK